MRVKTNFVGFITLSLRKINTTIGSQDIFPESVFNAPFRLWEYVSQGFF